MMPATNTVFHQQQQQQGAMATLQHLHPATPVSTQQTISLQQLQNLNPPTTQTTNLALQTLNVGGQQPSLSRSSQVVSLQHVQALAVSQSSQKAQPLSNPCSLLTTSPLRLQHIPPEGNFPTSTTGPLCQCVPSWWLYILCHSCTINTATEGQFPLPDSHTAVSCRSYPEIFRDISSGPNNYSLRLSKYSSRSPILQSCSWQQASSTPSISRR
ncbi:hypothetical protein GWK47_053043 [Chionoecetes opilio]|uniref:Uncharacterized protein n=1 Tax=Chionoecetes opilio TaxID=41210 RepID=A0A8J5CRG7_CHIOP|nr:hypothetical protein GWK47_053043 [Chionoecetes opilio]